MVILAFSLQADFGSNAILVPPGQTSIEHRPFESDSKEL
jgi:hypothetical protein